MSTSNVFNIVQLEKDLTAYFAGVLSLTVDTSIFRGQIPETCANGVACRIESRVTKTSIDCPCFNVQLLGKFANRDDAWVMLTKLAGAVPKWGETTTNFILVTLLPADGGSAPFTGTERGVLKHYASFNIRCSVLTRAA